MLPQPVVFLFFTGELDDVAVIPTNLQKIEFDITTAEGPSRVRNSKHAEAVEHWRRYLANDAQSEWAARARRSLKFCEMQMHLSAS